MPETSPFWRPARILLSIVRQPEELSVALFAKPWDHYNPTWRHMAHRQTNRCCVQLSIDTLSYKGGDGRHKADVSRPSLRLRW